ncbi:MAG TPA: hypothetical protein VNT77_11245 [Allosphingosinicella sp.]|nr:hypothetical protein [Allosphingosinicella sp.]
MASDRSTWRSAARAASALVLAALLALASSWIERRGPDHGVYCALGKVNGIDVYCPEPKLNGGWPAPFLFDKPGISVEWQLAFVEDDFRFWPFVANVAFYLLVLLGIGGAVRRARRKSPDR